MSESNSAESLRTHEEIPPGHVVYMVQCSNGAFYTGYTTDVDKRIATHNAGKGAKYTRAHLPVNLLASWSFSSKGEALRVERAIKQLSRAHKAHLIEQTLQGQEAFPDWVVSECQNPSRSTPSPASAERPHLPNAESSPPGLQEPEHRVRAPASSGMP